MTDKDTSARVLVFGGHFLPGFKAGGPVRSLKAVLDSTDPSTVCDVVVYDRDLGDRAPYPGLTGRVVPYGPHLVYYMNVRSPRHWLTLARRVVGRHYDLVFVHSLWELSFSVVPMLAVVLGVIRAPRVVIAPHGQLSAGALSSKARVKGGLLWLWRRLVGKVPVTWHSTASHETTDIVRLFPTADVITTIGRLAAPPVEQALPSRPGPPRLIFLSRISPMKNLELVLYSLALCDSQVVLDIYGPIGDPSYWARCRTAIDRLPEHVRVTYHGPVEPTETRDLFATHDAFLLPTLGENFGHAIAESLSVGCPVVCSRNTTWTQVLDHGAGAAVEDLSPRPYLEAVKEFAARDVVERSRRKEAALRAYRRWVEAQHEPNIISEALRKSA